MRVLERTFHPERLEQVYIVLTRRCNLHCPHCVRGQRPYIATDMSTDDFRRATRAVHDLVGSRVRVVLTGGEPTCHHDLVAMLSYCRDLFPDITIVTNGTNEGMLSAALATTPGVRVQVSIDGDREAHDSIRGGGVFEAAVSSVSRLIQAGIEGISLDLV